MATTPAALRQALPDSRIDTGAEILRTRFASDETASCACVEQTKLMLRNWTEDYGLPVPQSVVFGADGLVQLLYAKMHLAQLDTNNNWRLGYWQNPQDVTCRDLRLPDKLDTVNRLHATTLEKL